MTIFRRLKAWIRKQLDRWEAYKEIRKWAKIINAELKDYGEI